MSDNIVRIIPKDPLYKISIPTRQKTKTYLEANVSCDSIEILCGMTPMFIDCGSNLERINCPNCGLELSLDWWIEAMDHASVNEFTSLLTELPCCGSMISLNDLAYHYPCGFACCAIDILNPDYDMMDHINSIQSLLNTKIRIIKKHI